MSSHKSVTLCGLGMYSQDGDLRLVEIDVRNTGFGCMMFLTKNDYKEVPKELLVYYGDDYMIFKIKINNYFISSCLTKPHAIILIFIFIFLFHLV